MSVSTNEPVIVGTQGNTMWTGFQALVISSEGQAIQASMQALITTGLQNCYEQGFADGANSVPTTGISPTQEQSDIANAVAAAVAPLNTQISSLQLTVQQEQALLASLKTAVQAVVALFPTS